MRLAIFTFTLLLLYIMTSIQNLACIQATINPSDKRISLNKDVLRGKKILGLYLFSCTAGNKIKSPYKDEFIALTSELHDISLFSNLQDIDGSLFIKDYSLENSILDTESASNNKLIEYCINRLLDLDTSFISYKGSLASQITLMVYVLYQTENFEPITDEVNGSVTFRLPITSGTQDIKLSDFVNYTLKGKAIKQILFDNATLPLLGYLDIMHEHGKIENVPVSTLQNRSPKEFVFDGVKIDFEKSFYRHRDMTAPTNAYITFIY